MEALSGRAPRADIESKGVCCGPRCTAIPIRSRARLIEEGRHHLLARQHLRSRPARAHHARPAGPGRAVGAHARPRRASSTATGPRSPPSPTASTACRGRRIWRCCSRSWTSWQGRRWPDRHEARRSPYPSSSFGSHSVSAGNVGDEQQHDQHRDVEHHDRARDRLHRSPCRWRSRPPASARPAASAGRCRD